MDDKHYNRANTMGAAKDGNKPGGSGMPSAIGSSSAAGGQLYRSEFLKDKIIEQKEKRKRDRKFKKT